jgi:hypothetical protein
MISINSYTGVNQGQLWESHDQPHSYTGVIRVSSEKAMISISPVTAAIGIIWKTAVITNSYVYNYILVNNIGCLLW